MIAPMPKLSVKNAWPMAIKTAFHDNWEKLGSNKLIWQLNYHVGILHLDEENLQVAETSFRKAFETLNYVIDQIQDQDLLDKFLERKEVRNLIEMKEKIEL